MELEFLRLKFPLENTIQQPRNKQSVETNVENQKTPTQEEITECKPTLCMQQPKKKAAQKPTQKHQRRKKSQNAN